MRARIHRGTHEIGGTCVELEADGRRIIIDAGLPLDWAEGTAPPLPSIDWASLCGVLISHPHLDHYGLLPRMPETGGVPVAIGGAARSILRAAAPFVRKETPAFDGPSLQDRRPIRMGPFTITPYLVDHSAYDSYSLLIEAQGRRLFYSGDFRAHGRKRALFERLIAEPPLAIDALLLEGTLVGQEPHAHRIRSESDLQVAFQRAFKETRGLALVHASAQNIDRMVTIFKASKDSSRTLLVDLYAAAMLEATDNPRIPQSHWEEVALCVPHRQRVQIKEEGWFTKLDRHKKNRVFLDREVRANPERYVLLFRPLWRRDLERAGCLKDAVLIHSQWKGYLEEKRFQEIERWRASHGIGFEVIHTSGHASIDDLRRLARALNPGKLVPIHTASPDGFGSIHERVVRHSDGEWWDV